MGATTDGRSVGMFSSGQRCLLDLRDSRRSDTDRNPGEYKTTANPGMGGEPDSGAGLGYRRVLVLDEKGGKGRTLLPRAPRTR